MSEPEGAEPAKPEQVRGSDQAVPAEQIQVTLVRSADALRNVAGSRPRPGGRGRYAALNDEQIATENQRLRLSLRRTIALVAGSIAAAQVVVADIVFIVYANVGKHWRVPTGAIDVWLGATVVQVIGVVLVITRSLFPERAGKDD